MVERGEGGGGIKEMGGGGMEWGIRGAGTIIYVLLHIGLHGNDG